MTTQRDKIDINARIQIDSDTLQALVSNSKQTVGPDARGIYRIDTAEVVNRLITAFLEEKGFNTYIRDMENYKPICGRSE